MFTFNLLPFGHFIQEANSILYLRSVMIHVLVALLGYQISLTSFKKNMSIASDYDTCLTE